MRKERKGAEREEAFERNSLEEGRALKVRAD